MGRLHVKNNNMSRRSSLGIDGETSVVSKVKRSNTSQDTSVGRTSNRGNKTSSVIKKGYGDTSFATPTIYSYNLPVDIFQTPRSYDERVTFYREVYRRDPLIGRAIDLHSELPLSKVRLSLPDGPDPVTNRYVFNFYKKMTDRIRLFENLISLTHEYNLTGDGNLFLEEDSENLTEPFPETVDEAQDLLDNLSDEQMFTEHNKFKLSIKELNPNYKGWLNAVVIPSENVRVHRFTFSDEIVAEFIPDESMKSVLRDSFDGFNLDRTSHAITDTEQVEKVRDSIPDDIQELIQSGGQIYLDTDPMQGSFLINMSRNLGPELSYGVSMLERCIDVLTYRDKLRQAQSAIASRNMTPKRLVWAENLSVEDVEILRDQVDQAQETPDYSVVTNYEVHWEEIVPQDRLLDLSNEYDITDRLIMYGMGITPDILTGEGTYTGNRVGLEIMNNHYLLFREMIQFTVEEKIFKPVALKKGFFIKDEFGLIKILFPLLSFTRLAVRDAAETFEHMMSLYLKGSLPIRYIYDLLNIPYEDANKALTEDIFTPRDPKFNQLLDTAYSGIGDKIAEVTDALQKITKELGLKIKEEAPETDAGRFE